MPRIKFNPYTSCYLEIVKKPKDSIALHQEWAAADPFIRQAEHHGASRRQTLPAHHLPHLEDYERSKSFALSHSDEELDENLQYDGLVRLPLDPETSSVSYAESIMYAPSTIYAGSEVQYGEHATLLSDSLLGARSDHTSSTKSDKRSKGQNVSREEHALGGRSAPAGLLPRRVFGAPLQETVGIASVPATVQGEAIVVPIVVNECGRFLLRRGTSDGFQPSNSERVDVLRTAFSDPVTYGRSIDWDLYKPQDAAGALAAYFFSLPSPVIPFHLYNAFRFWFLNAAITPPETMIQHYQSLVLQLPEFHRDLLVYMLDFFAQLHDRRDYRNCLMFRFTPALVRDRPRPVRDRRRQLMFLPRHSHLPTLLYLMEIREEITAEKIQSVQGQVAAVEVAPVTPARRNSNLLNVLRGIRRPSAGPRIPTNASVLPAGASRLMP